MVINTHMLVHILLESISSLGRIKTAKIIFQSIR
uniref:Uncharacterized protein n=1 Tax=virus sp. ctx9V1 TaxID=2828001 RepID=A0A8S5RDB0_9VIRU|nr:MAG TPA: hypothetical protein [virus sp. ctx9V1]DAJ73273.1 MAG TPA: hypothetical protein [Caudoviricetes sp.]